MSMNKKPESYYKYKDMKIYELDELGWDCCVVNGKGGVHIDISEKEVLIIDIDQLKTMVDHAENVEETIQEGS